MIHASVCAVAEKLCDLLYTCALLDVGRCLDGRVASMELFLHDALVCRSLSVTVLLSCSRILCARRCVPPAASQTRGGRRAPMIGPVCLDFSTVGSVPPVQGPSPCVLVTPPISPDQRLKFVLCI